MQKQFAQKLEDLRRLIEEQRSASSAHSTLMSSDCLSVMSSDCLSVMSSERSESRHLFLLAVSGGMDSMCLLDLFSKTLQPSEYAVAHCNFSLRGEESDGDQALVEARAAELGVEVFVQRFDTVTYAQERGISIEMAARDLRYGWFADLCRQKGYDAVVVAHNANDNAETLMLNLLRGTGLNGLHGMSELSEQSVPVCRPLLDFTRKQIEGYVLYNRVPYRHDSSNFESDYKRNKIRNEVFPVFEKINPSYVRTLNREIGYFTEAGDIVEEWCKSQLPSVISYVDPSVTSNVISSDHPTVISSDHPTVISSDHPTVMSSDHPTVMSSERSESRYLHVNTPALLATKHWRYLLYYILSPYGFNQQILASVESLLTSSRTIPGKRFESADYTLLTGRDSLAVVPREQETDAGTEAIMAVRGEGIYNFNGAGFRVEILKRTPEMLLKQPVGTLIFDAARLRFPFVCRRWRQGDWLVPLGMRGKKKVSDIFTDLKYDTFSKEKAIMIVDVQTDGMAEQQHIAGLLGVRADDAYKVTPATETILKIVVTE